jgi:SAM-dependent methyltransferase
MDPGGQAEVHAYYGRDEERERLDAALGVVEFERTKEIITRHLQPPPATVADIGGGPGRYSIWLAEGGYRVHHRDLVPLHVEHAKRDAAAANVEIDSREGDARAVDLPDASVDAVLLLGPLYHLPKRADRIAALREAGRIVRAGGFVFAAAISRWAARLHGVLVERIHEKFPDVLDLLGEVERSGRLPPLHEGAFAGFTHRPRELRTEARVAGLDPIDLVGVEGLAFALPDLETLLETGLGRQIVFDAARAFERVPELLGLGPHLILTAQRRA